MEHDHNREIAELKTNLENSIIDDENEKEHK